VEPALWPEDLGVAAPQVLHSPHGVRDVEDDVSLADAEAARQHIVREALLVVLMKHEMNLISTPILMDDHTYN